MHIVFVHYNYLINDTFAEIDKNTFKNKNIKTSIIQRSDTNSIEGNKHYIKDEFDQSLRWWQNPEILNDYIAGLKPDIVYIFGLNLPLHFRWLKHHINSDVIIIAQHCGEELWLQRNLWLQQFGLRVVNGFVFASQNDAIPWIKCAAILESQPVFELEIFINEIEDIYKNFSKI
jgi:hypothetical protein